MAYYGGWAPYVPVAKRRAKAERRVKALRKRGMKIEPVEIEGRKIARTFWGEAWCSHLEGFSDYSNRLPRGRTYVRNGSVCHLGIERGRVEAMVSGSEIYDVHVEISNLPGPKWTGLKKRCAGQIGSMLDLLRGRLSKNILAIVTDRDQGLFPLPGEIHFRCSCPDWATMCKHVAAVLYGVGARLDHSPELLFLLRGVDHEELISVEADVVAAATGRGGRRRRIAADDLGDVFDIEMDGEGAAGEIEKPPRPPAAKPRTRKKAPARRRKSAQATTTSTAAEPEPASAPDTADAVARLRRKLGLTRGEMARLLGVSAASVSNWERSETKLNLQARTAKALTEAAGLSKRQARARLKRKGAK
jgi:uncharacterized Zn finger protein